MIEKSVFKQISKILGYSFKNKQILIEALTHPSCNKDKKQKMDYERLEFLGDSVLSLVIAEMVVDYFPDHREGSLARKKANVISNSYLSVKATQLSLGQFIIMSKGEEGAGGRSKPSNLENVLEAVIGAIYLDGGFKKAKKFIIKNWEKDVCKHSEDSGKDPKTLLQELSHKYKLGNPTYFLEKKVGHDHEPLFHVSVKLGDKFLETAAAKSKKLAEKKVAELLLAKLDDIINPTKEKED